MATNPMQRKARNSFLLGMLVMLLIAGIVIGLLIFLLMQERKARQEQEKIETLVYVLNRDVESGQIITEDMLTLTKLSTEGVPSNAIKDLSTMENFSLIEKDTGNSVGADEGGLYVIDESGETTQRIRIVKDGDNYYKSVNGQKKLVEFATAPIVAKTAMKSNTVITTDSIARSDEIAEDDLRVVEYNMLSLPVKLNVDDYIDIRFTLPNGVDYIVVSKKRVLDVINDTIWVLASEEEILTMSNAIVEAYMMAGSKLTATLYVEPGLQEIATPTYVVSKDVYNVMKTDPNILEKAMKELVKRYNSLDASTQRQDNIDPRLVGDEPRQRLEEKVEEEITRRKEERNKYLEELYSATLATE